VAEITETITLQGSWNATFTERDPQAYPTTMDAQGNGRVIQIDGNISPTIEGFIITGGDATDEALLPRYGGGIFSSEASPIIQNNVITNNIAYAGPPTFEGFGGGIYMSSGSASSIISGNIIISNTASTTYYGRGGGLAFLLSAARVMGNHIINNTGNWRGGGIYLNLSDGVAFSGNQIISNTTSATDWAYGGGFYIEFTSPFTLTNNIIAQNRGKTLGGGLYVLGIAANVSSGEVVNNTIAQNTLGSVGEGVFADGATTLTLTNNIVVSHTYGIYAGADSSVTADYTLFHGNTSGNTGSTAPGTITSTNEVSGDPLFVNPDVWDYHIQADSPAIDAGTAIPWLTTDIDGDPRPIGTGYDIGADERLLYIYLPLILKNY